MPQLRISVDSEGARQFFAMFEKYSSSLEKTTKEWEKINKQIKSATEELKKATAASDRSRSGERSASVGAAATDESARRRSRQIDQDLERAREAKRITDYAHRKGMEAVSLEMGLHKREEREKQKRQVQDDLDKAKEAKRISELAHRKGMEAVAQSLRAFKPTDDPSKLKLISQTAESTAMWWIKAMPALNLSMRHLSMLQVAFGGMAGGMGGMGRLLQMITLPGMLGAGLGSLGALVAGTILGAPGARREDIEARKLMISPTERRVLGPALRNLTEDPTALIAAAGTAETTMSSPERQAYQLIFGNQATTRLQDERNRGHLMADTFRALQQRFQNVPQQLLGDVGKQYFPAVGGIQNFESFMRMDPKQQEDFLKGLEDADKKWKDSTDQAISAMDKLAYDMDQLVNSVGLVVTKLEGSLAPALDKIVNVLNFIAESMTSKPYTDPNTGEQYEVIPGEGIKKVPGPTTKPAEGAHAAGTPGPTVAALQFAGGDTAEWMKQWFMQESFLTKAAGEAAQNRDQRITDLMQWLQKREDKSDKVDNDLINLINILEGGSTKGGAGSVGPAKFISNSIGRSGLGPGFGGAGAGAAYFGPSGGAVGNIPSSGIGSSGLGPGSGGVGGGAAVGSSSFLDALADIESGNSNIYSKVDRDVAGPNSRSQGYFQINTPTWREFAGKAGVDLNKYPNAMSAPRAVQAQVASIIPFSRFGPRTQRMMRAKFGNIDSRMTVGALAAIHGGTSKGGLGAQPAIRSRGATAGGIGGGISGTPGAGGGAIGHELSPGGAEPQAFIMHHTAGRGDPQGVVNFWKQQGRGYGAQYIMDRAGVVHDTAKEFGYGGTNEILNDPTRGLSNRNVVGMEIIAKNDADVTAAQAASAAAFMKKYYPNTPVYGHGQVNPGHKEATEGQTARLAVETDRAAVREMTKTAREKVQPDRPISHTPESSRTSTGPLSMINWEMPDRRQMRMRVDNNIGADVAMSLATISHG
jgi:hypothetical protein